ncbi:hypothetical protein WG66_011731 [Moniliophthora roreri]|nr:hypothetical protein WG66_011731 [Moniliophthora roreri]
MSGITGMGEPTSRGVWVPLGGAVVNGVALSAKTGAVAGATGESEGESEGPEGGSDRDMAGSSFSGPSSVEWGAKVGDRRLAPSVSPLPVLQAHKRSIISCFLPSSTIDDYTRCEVAE